MLLKENRVPADAFKRRGRVVYRGKYFFIKKSDNKMPRKRFGVVIGRRIFKKATERNKFRRLVYDFIRMSSNLDFKKGEDILIIFQTPSSNPTLREVKEELKKALSYL